MPAINDRKLHAYALPLSIGTKIDGSNFRRIFWDFVDFEGNN